MELECASSYRERAPGLEVQGGDVDENLGPRWGHLKDHLSKSGILSWTQGSVLWPSARVTLAAWLCSRKGGRLPP